MNEPVTKEKVDKAIAWYWLNRVTIERRLPIWTPGVTFNVGWTARVECQIEIWEKGPYPVSLATAYIYCPIRLVAGSIINHLNS